MEHLRPIILAALFAWMPCGYLLAQSNPALERGTPAAAAAIAEGQARIEKEVALLQRRLAIQRETVNGKALNGANEDESKVNLPPKVQIYLKWSTEQAAIKLWPADEPFGVTYGTFQDQFGAGDLGFVPQIQVVQIIDENSARVNLTWYMPVQWKAVGPAGGSWYQLGERTLENVILRDVSMRGMVDDVEYRLAKVLEISGTERYTTTSGGSKTVFVVRPFDVEPFRAAFEAAQKAQAEKVAHDQAEQKKLAAEREKADQAKRQEERHRQLTRTWTDSTGGFAVNGRLIDVLPGPKAKIERKDGMVIEVPFFKLSKADRTWILTEGKFILESED